MNELIPPDYNQCQCEITEAHGPFKFGPKPRPERCKNKPVFLAVEIIAGKDGRHGAMTLCLGCAEQMFKQPELAQRVQLQPIMGSST